MRRKNIVIFPLLLAVTLSLLTTPAVAQVVGHEMASEGRGVERLGWFRYCRGEAGFTYLALWDIGAGEPIFGYAGLDLGVDKDGVWLIDFDTFRESEGLITFKAEYVNAFSFSIGGLAIVGHSDLCCGDIRVLTFLKGDDSVFVIVYGLGVYYKGCGTIETFSIPLP